MLVRPGYLGWPNLTPGRFDPPGWVPLLFEATKEHEMDVSARVSSKGQVTIPRAVRKALAVERGMKSSFAWKALDRSWH
jgi:hypothetical protein